MTNGTEANEARITYLENEIKEHKKEMKKFRKELREKRQKVYSRIEKLERVDQNQNRILNPIKKIAGWIVSAVAGALSYVFARSLIAWIK